MNDTPRRLSLFVLTGLILATTLVAGCDTDNKTPEISSSKGALAVSVLTWLPSRYRQAPDETAIRITEKLTQMTGVRCEVITLDDVKNRDIALTPQEAIDVLVGSVLPGESTATIHAKLNPGRELIQKDDEPEKNSTAHKPDVVILPRLDELAQTYVQGLPRGMINIVIGIAESDQPALDFVASSFTPENIYEEMTRFAPRLTSIFPESYWKALQVDGKISSIPARSPIRDDLIWIIRNDLLAKSTLASIDSYTELAGYWLESLGYDPDGVVLALAPFRWSLSLRWLVERHLENEFGIRLINLAVNSDLMSPFYVEENTTTVRNLFEDQNPDILDSLRVFSQTTTHGPFEQSGNRIKDRLTINLISEADRAEPRWICVGVPVEPEFRRYADDGYLDTQHRIIADLLSSDEYSVFVPWRTAHVPVIEPQRYPAIAISGDMTAEDRASLLTGIDSLVTQEAFDLTHYGIEDVNWEEATGGSVTLIPDGDSNYSSQFHFPIGELAHPDVYRRRMDDTPPVLQKYVDDYRKYFGRYEVDMLSGFSFNIAPVANEVSEYRDNIMPELNQFMTGVKSLEVDWHRFVGEHKNTTKVIRAELQRQIDEFLLGKYGSDAER